MSESSRLKETVLHPFHLSCQAQMASFGGYHMPLWYSAGTKAEHLAVIERAGLFDTSHMAVLTVTGAAAFDLLQHTFSKDLDRCGAGGAAPLAVGRSVYGLFLRTDATVLDDAIVARLGADRFMVVVNSGMGGIVNGHLRELAEGEVSITDYSDLLGKIDLQGPASALILEKLLDDPDAVLGDMGYFSFKGDLSAGGPAGLALADGTRVLLSRTGYTGEFGFELFVDRGAALHLWQALLAAGQPYGLIPCGLAARDSLRAGALLPLSHQDIGDWPLGHTPWSFALSWDEAGSGFTKMFVGATRLLQDEGGYTCGFAGYDPRKIAPSATSVVEDEQGRPLGTILTCTTDMAIDRVGERIVSVATPISGGRPESFRARGLSCGLVRTTRPCRVGERVWLVEGKRRLAVEIRADIRPDRSARRPMRHMRNHKGERKP